MHMGGFSPGLSRRLEVVETRGMWSEETCMLTCLGFPFMLLLSHVAGSFDQLAQEILLFPLTLATAPQPFVEEARAQLCLCALGKLLSCLGSFRKIGGSNFVCIERGKICNPFLSLVADKSLGKYCVSYLT